MSLRAVFQQGAQQIRQGLDDVAEPCSYLPTPAQQTYDPLNDTVGPATSAMPFMGMFVGSSDTERETEATLQCLVAALDAPGIAFASGDLLRRADGRIYAVITAEDAGGVSALWVLDVRESGDRWPT